MVAKKQTRKEIHFKNPMPTRQAEQNFIEKIMEVKRNQQIAYNRNEKNDEDAHSEYSDNNP